MAYKTNIKKKKKQYNKIKNNDKNRMYGRLLVILFTKTKSNFIKFEVKKNCT